MPARNFSYLFLLLLFLNGCAAVDMEKAPLVLRPASFSDMPGWDSDDQAQTLTAFGKSCARILAKDPATPFGADAQTGTYGDWQKPCRALPQLPAGANAAEARSFFETWFQPWQATADGAGEGLFTGYYEAALRGSRARHGPYQYPLRLRPPDLVMVELGDFRDELKGQRIAGRVQEGRLKPFEDRAKINAGTLPGDDRLTFVWVDDPVDSFFLQIQGSGRILLDDGSELRVGYDGQNGYPYYAVGRELVKRGELDKESVSMQSIRAWLAAHPQEAGAVMDTNRSYVFFRELPGQEPPLGAEGVPLTAGRSLAVDRTRIPYGVPLWVDIDPPAAGEPALRRLVVAQDTGGAIRGPVRGDFFWGYGPRAQEMAGIMKAPGRLWLLLPRR